MGWPTRKETRLMGHRGDLVLGQSLGGTWTYSHSTSEAAQFSEGSCSSIAHTLIHIGGQCGPHLPCSAAPQHHRRGRSCGGWLAVRGKENSDSGLHLSRARDATESAQTSVCGWSKLRAGKAPHPQLPLMLPLSGTRIPVLGEEKNLRKNLRGTESPWAQPSDLVLQQLGIRLHPDKVVTSTQQTGDPVSHPTPVLASPSPFSPHWKWELPANPGERHDLCPHQIQLSHQKHWEYSMYGDAFTQEHPLKTVLGNSFT